MRRQGWEELLAGYLAEAESLSFAWGVNDCALWAGRWLRLCAGIDNVAPFENRYDSEIGAKRALAEEGYDSLEHAFDDALEVTPVMLARRGDIVMHPDRLVGICSGVNGCFLTDTGLLHLPYDRCVKAWRVE